MVGRRSKTCGLEPPGSSESQELASGIYRPVTGFNHASLLWLADLFREHLGSSKELTFENFQNIVKTKNPFFAERVFHIFDKDGNGTVSLQEFMDSVQQFAGQSHDEKVRFMFKVYDLDGDGLIQYRELLHVMHACMEENSMTFTEDQIEDLTMALFEDADPDRRGEITYEALKAQLTKHPGLLENISISIDRWLVPPPPKRRVSVLEQLSRLRPYQCSRPYWRNNATYLTALFVYVAVNVALAVHAALSYAAFPPLYILARIGGALINLNGMFLLVTVLRNLITLARTYGLAGWLPLDEHLYFHKMAGWIVFVSSLVHTFAHLGNFALEVVPPDGALASLNEGNYSYAEWLLTTRPGKFGLIPGLANPTGITLDVIVTVMVVCSLPLVRKEGKFEVFYFTHLLYIPFFILGIIHCANFWKWVVAPGSLYVLERIIRFVRSRSGHGKTYVSSGIRLPSRVTHLVIKRPPNMVFHPGDYIFVKIPAIAKYEWHPFTISSAPEQEDTLWLHIRALGGWTNRLYSYFEEEEAKLLRAQAEINHDRRQSNQVAMLATMTPGSNISSFPSVFSPTPKLSRPRQKGDSGDAEAHANCQEIVLKPLNINGHRVGQQDGTPTSSAHGKGSGTRTPSPSLFARAHSLPIVEYRRRKETKVLTVQRSMSEKAVLDSLLQADDRATLEALFYKSPLNRTVARSFRYMRRKPTIVAFDLPKDDSQENLLALPTAATATATDLHTAEARAEEGITAPEDVVIERTEEHDVYPVGKPLEIYIDGPYGAPASHIFRAQHAVLIGAGIGVTPYASILQSIMYRHWKNLHKCPKCDYQWASDFPTSVMNLRKVDFFWINRDQRSFEWFVSLLSQLEIEQAEQGSVMDRFLDMHMYITSALQKTDMKAVGLQLALDLLHQREKRDLITGLKTRTNAGRPDWNVIFRDIQARRKGKVTVFFCGPPALSRTLRVKCGEFGFKYRKEIF